MLVAVAAIDVGETRRAADGGAIVGQGRTFADPAALLGAADTGEDVLEMLLEEIGAVPGGRLVRRRQLDRAGDAQAVGHRREEQAAIGRADRQVEAHIVRRHHHMIAAFGDQRRVEAQQAGQLARGAARRDHHGARGHFRIGELHRRHAVAVAAEAAHAAAHDRAALGGEALDQGRDHLVRIDRVRAVRIVDAAHDGGAEARCQLARPVAVDDLELGALARLQPTHLVGAQERRLALVDVERAAGAEQLAEARGLDLGLPGDVGLEHQRPEHVLALLDLGPAHRRNGKARHPGQQPGQAGRMQRERPVPVHQHLRHLLQGGRPRQRDQAVDGQEAGIAEGGRVAGLGAVEQRHLVAVALQGAGRGGADDSGADDDDGVALG